MNLVILGAGQVGGTLAELLNDGTNMLTLVDTSSERLQLLSERLDGIATALGNAALPETLRSANVEDADLLIAVTGADEINIVASQIAREVFSTPKIIVRVRSKEYEIEKAFKDKYLPVDDIINPEREVMRQIKQLLEHKSALQVLSFAGGLVSCVGFRSVSNLLPTGLSAKQLDSYLPTDNVNFLAVYRGNKLLTNRSKENIEPNDEIFIMAPTEDIEETLSVCRGPTGKVRKICIAGGGHIGTALAKDLQENYAVRVIEYQQRRVNEVSRELNDGILHQGDATDRNKLLECEIADTDLFCAVTNDDEINVMSSLLAKHEGAGHAVALLSKDSYLDLIHGTSIDVGISPQRTTASTILAYVREHSVQSAHRLRIGNAEIFETKISGSEGENKITGKSVRQLKLKNGAKIGAVVRDSEVLNLNDDPKFEEGDSVVVFVPDSSNVPETIKLFQPSPHLFF